jgi:hypothetical protein
MINKRDHFMCGLTFFLFQFCFISILFRFQFCSISSSNSARLKLSRCAEVLTFKKVIFADCLIYQNIYFFISNQAVFSFHSTTNNGSQQIIHRESRFGRKTRLDAVRSEMKENLLSILSILQIFSPASTSMFQSKKVKSPAASALSLLWTASSTPWTKEPSLS